MCVCVCMCVSVCLCACVCVHMITIMCTLVCTSVCVCHGACVEKRVQTVGDVFLLSCGFQGSKSGYQACGKHYPKEICLLFPPNGKITDFLFEVSKCFFR